MLPLVPLNIILKKNCDFMSCLERFNLPGIYQGFMAAIPRLDFLKNAILKIMFYTKINFYPKIPRRIGLSSFLKDLIEKLSITGPCLLYNSMKFKKRPNLGYTKLEKKLIYLLKFSRHIFNIKRKYDYKK